MEWQPFVVVICMLCCVDCCCIGDGEQKAGKIKGKRKSIWKKGSFILYRHLKFLKHIIFLGKPYFVLFFKGGRHLLKYFFWIWENACRSPSVFVIITISLFYKTVFEYTHRKHDIIITLRLLLPAHLFYFSSFIFHFYLLNYNPFHIIFRGSIHITQ